MLKDDHKTKRMGSALKFLTRSAHEGDEFLDSIVTEDETRCFHHTPESKQQFLQKQKIQNFNFCEKKIHGVRFLGRKRHSPG
jgi:hypothetical protein